MKDNGITLFAPEFPPYRGGIANYSHTMAKNLVNNGFVVSVITFNTRSIKDGYNVISPGWSYNPDNWATPIRRVISLIYRLYQKYFFEEIVYEWDKTYSREHNRIIITTLFYDYSRKLVLKCVKKQIPFDIVLHGLDIYEISETYREIFCTAIFESRRIWVNSRSTRSILIERYSELRDKVLIFPPLLDTNKIDQLDLLSKDSLGVKWGVNQNHQWICSICRLVKRKGIDLAISAVIQLLESNETVSYLIAGFGEEEKLLRGMVPDHLIDRIVFLGNITEEEKYSLLHHSKIFLMPNRFIPGDIEGFGISFIEASYMKCWVVGGRNGGVLEAVDESTNAFLVDTENNAAQSIFTVLTQLIHKSDSMKLEGGKKFVQENYSLGRVWQL